MTRLPAKELRLAMLALAAAGALLAGVYLLSAVFAPPVVPEASIAAATPPAAPVSPPPPSTPPADDARRAAVEATIAATPDIAPFFERLRASLPADYEAAVRKAVAAAADPATDTPDYWLSDAVKTVRQSHGALATGADAPALGAIFVRQAAVLDALSKQDARMCVDFLYGGASEAFFQFAAANRPLVSALAMAGLDAVLDGQARKVAREAPSDADFALLEEALKARGLTPEEIGALLDGKAPEPPLPDDRLCTIGRLYLEAIASLPEDTRMRIYALAVGLMARS